MNNVLTFAQPKVGFVFIHKRLQFCNFRIEASKWYEAVLELELLLGPQNHWLHEYLCVSNGRVIR